MQKNPNHVLRFLSCLLLILLQVGPLGRTVLAADLEVIIRDPSAYEDRHARYINETLAKALQKSGVQARFVVARSDFSRKRLLRELISGENIHVVAHAPRPGWEEQLLTVRVPLHKGLQGIRLFLINKRDQQDLSEVKTLKDLQHFPTGSGEQWSITPVLRDSGFHVVTAEGQRELYEMLRLRRMITFGRGVFEIFEELEKYGAGYPELVVEDHLALFVPLPVYFFVSPRHPELARHIETGLQRMIEDGSFDEHFLKYHGEDIEKASLSRRTLFRIPNPHLSAKTPTEYSPLWFDPSLLTQDLN